MTNTPSSRRSATRRRIAAVAATAIGGALLVVATPTVDAAAARVTICHQVGNLSYRVVTVDANAVSGGGHGHHSGDIIPAFVMTQGNRELHFPGRNLSTVLRAADGLTGAQVVAAGCNVPPVAPTAQLTTQTSAAIAVPTPTETLAPTQTTQAVPTPTETAVPGTGAQTTLAPNTTPPTPTAAPTATPAPTAPQPTLAPDRTVAPDTTAPADCPEGELAHGGECFAVPPLVIPQAPSLLTITSQPDNSSLTPIVECVDRRSDGISVVWFGYESTADEPVVVERGPANVVSPRGTPPTLFGPGVHIFVVAVETTDGVASWTLAGETATAGADSRDCSAPLTNQPATTQPDTTQPTTSEPETTAPGTTEPGTTDPGTASPGTCPPGEAETDGECAPVEPVRLVLVDNVLECDGHGVARFAAFNDNVFALEADNATSLVSPARLAADAPEVIDERDVVSDDGTETVALFTVRYVTAVTWTVSHHGLEASISAGTNGATTNPDCPDAIVASSGTHGLLSAPGPLATTGSDDALPFAMLAALLSAFGLGLVIAARRRPAGVD